MAVELGLHKVFPTSRNPASSQQKAEILNRRRTYLILLVQDRMYSLRTGLKCNLSLVRLLSLNQAAFYKSLM
jgi:hypothetical protein